MPYPLPLTRTEAYLAYKAGVIQQSDLKPSLAIPRNGIDAWLAYWTGLTNNYPVKNVGKNLFDKDKALDNYFYTSTGSKSTYSKPQFYNNKFSPKSNKITMSFSAAHDRQNGSNIEANVRIVQYDANGNFISRFMSRANGHTFTLDNNTESFILSVDNGPDAWFDDLQVEYGSTPTAYEPYTGEPLILQEEEAYIAYLCGVINEYPEKCLRRVGAYLRYLISARWGRPDHPLNREELYLSLIKTQFIPSGDPSSDIVIDGTAKAAFVDVKMYGDTFQQSYEGKNCIGFPDQAERTINGLTYSLKDGIVTVNGTATATTFTDSSTLFNFKEAGDITLSIEILGGTESSSIIGFQNRNSQTAQLRWQQVSPSGSLKSTKAIDAQTISDTTDIRLYMNLGSVFNNFKFRLMAEYGSTATDYEPFVGGQPSPSPDYPQPIQTVTGEQAVEVNGKNLFDKNNPNMFIGYVGWNGAINPTSADRMIYIPCKPSTTYTIQKPIPSTNPKFRVAVSPVVPTNGGTATVLTNDSYMSLGKATVTTRADSAYLMVYVWVNSSDMSLDDVLSGIQIELGSTATAYEPYSSNDYEINLGKNLFGSQIVQGYYAFANGGFSSGGTTYVTNKDKISVTAGATYTISANKGVYDGSNYNGAGVVFFNNGTYVSSILRPENGTFTVPPGANQVVYNFYKGSSDSSITPNDITWVQLELGSTPTAYAPYFEPIELCNLGTYQDYIYKDGEDWKVHKATSKATFASSSNWSKSNSTANNLYINQLSGLALNSPLACNKLTVYESATLYSSSTIGLCYNTTVIGTASIRIGVGIDSGIDTIGKYGSWLAQTMPTVYYALATPTDTTITDTTLIAQLEALKNGGAENGTTYIKVNATDPNLPGLLYVEAPKYE